MPIKPLFPEHSDVTDKIDDVALSAFPPLDIEDTLPHCLMCGGEFVEGSLFKSIRVCPNCRFHYSIGARARIDSVIDHGTFKETHRWVESIDPLVFSPRISYSVRILKDQNRTGLLDAAVCGRAEIGDVPCAIIAIDPGFLGGSMGLVVGEKVARLFEDAAQNRLPVVAIVTSGGARIQEGVLSLTQMAKTIVAAARLRDDRGMPLISVLGNPSSGQILASFASISDIRIAEPGAYVGFAPLGLLREVEDDPAVMDRCTAETILARGHIDRVADRESIRSELAAILQMLRPSMKGMKKQSRSLARFTPRRTDAWQAVQTARRSDRPPASYYIGNTFRNFLELHGDRIGDDSKAIKMGLAYLGAYPVMVIGHERQGAGVSPERDESSYEPDSEASSVASFTDIYGYADLNRDGTRVEAFRKVRRAAQLAERFQLPLIVLIDTPGAMLGLDQEMNGLPGEIAATLDLMLRLETRVISVLIGEAAGEAALALGISDRLLMLEHAIYTPVSPESGAETELRDRTRAPELARSLRLTAYDALRIGVVDRVLPEPTNGAHEDPASMASMMKQALIGELENMPKRHRRTVARRRRKKFRRIGEYGPQFRAALRREMQTLQGYLSAGVRKVFSGPSDNKGD